MKSNQATVYLNLFKIKLPLAGMVSFFHRITGILLVLSIPFVLYLFGLSLKNEAGFQQVVGVLNSPALIIIEVIVFALLAFHFFAGVRFLLVDLNIGLTKKAANKSSWIVIITTVFFTAIFSLLRGFS